VRTAENRERANLVTEKIPEQKEAREQAAQIFGTNLGHASTTN